MQYIPTNWVDGETPVNAENLNKLEQAVQANDTAINEINAARQAGEFKGDPGRDGITPVVEIVNGKELDGRNNMTITVSSTDENGVTMTSTGSVKDGQRGANGKSAYQYAQDGGYTGTEEEFAEKLAQERLVGVSTTIKPRAVVEAIETGREVIILHTNNNFGLFWFTSFDVNASMGLIFSSSILQYNGMYAVVELIGDYDNTNEWNFVVQQIPIMSDVPTKTSQLTNDSGFLTSAPVTSVNGMTGDVFIPHVSSIGVSEMDGQAGIGIQWEEDENLTQAMFIPNPPSKLPNPNALTINGTSYDGSKAVSMTIGGSGDSIPEYIKTEADRVAKVVQSRQNANTITFLACSDIHYYSPDNATANANAEKMHEAVVSMGQAMGLIRERCHIDFAVMFGDMTWDSGETHDEILSEMRFVNSCLHKGFAGIPQFRMEGNHDDAYESGGNLTTGEIFANIGAWNTGAVYGSRTAGYCYRDFDSVKLRVIALNTSEYKGSGFLTTSQQVTWLAKALNLSEKGAGWRSIILSHHPLEFDKAGGVNPISTINGASGLVASFHGHIHNFLTGTVTGTELPRISIPNAGYSRENQYSAWKESTTYSKTPGTAQNTSFCVITIDTDAKKIYADHYGAGYDRIIPYEDVELATYTVTNNLTNVTSSSSATSVEEGKAYSATLTANSGYEISSVVVKMGGTDITATAYSGGKVTIASVTGNIVITATATEVSSGPSYTNLVPTSIDATGAIYGEDYNGDGTPDGYKNGKYASGANEGADSACVLTGLIPYGEGCTTPIYIKGADVTTASHCRILGFDASKSISNQAPAGTSLATYFTVETLGTQYYKLTPTSELKTSSGFTDYLRFSLIGTGENLIITLNEPIE